MLSVEIMEVLDAAGETFAEREDRNRRRREIEDGLFWARKSRDFDVDTYLEYANSMN